MSQVRARIAIGMTALLWVSTAYADDEATIAVGKAAVAAKLIDPGSAQFTDVRSPPGMVGRSFAAMSARRPAKAQATRSRLFS
jgi:hypothetical protein